MIRFLKEEPFVVPMVMACILTSIVVVAALIGAILSPYSANHCQDGYVQVGTSQGRGCVSEQVWKDMQK